MKICWQLLNWLIILSLSDGGDGDSLVYLWSFCAVYVGLTVSHLACHAAQLQPVTPILINRNETDCGHANHYNQH